VRPIDGKSETAESLHENVATYYATVSPMHNRNERLRPDALPPSTESNRRCCRTFMIAIPDCALGHDD
jgi:hypothetical protein